MKAIVKSLAGCVALAITLGSATAFADLSVVVRSLLDGMAAVGQAPPPADAAVRQEADKWLKQARQAMKDGNLELARYYVDRAEKLGAKYDPLFARLVDTPAKVRADLDQLTNQGPSPQRPSTATASSAAGPGRPAPPDPYSVSAGARTADQLADDSKAKARLYLNNGRRALEQKDLAGAVGWYHQAVATRATLAQGEYSPAELAAQLQAAGVQPSLLVAKADAAPAPFVLSPADAQRENVGRLPPVLKDSTDKAFPVMDNPYAVAPRGESRNPAKTEALRLAALARAALDRGDLAAALRLAEQAQSLKVPEAEFAPGELRPWEVTLQVQSALRMRNSSVAPAMHNEPAAAAPQGSYPVAQGLHLSDQDTTRVMPAQATAPPSEGLRLYEEGLRALENQNRAQALSAFRKAWQFQQELDPYTRQQLQDKLSLLGVPDQPSAGSVPPSPLEEVGVQQEVLRQKMFREVAAEQQEAERMTATDPRGALDRLQRLRERVSQAELAPESQKQLLTLVDRSIQDVDSYIQQHRQEIELRERNREVSTQIEQQQREKIEVQDKVAELVEKFNTLVEEERFAEAELIANQVRELDPNSPIAKTLALKSRFISRSKEQEWLRDEKEKGVYGALTEVEKSGVPFNESKGPIDFGDVSRWNELTASRQKFLESQRRQLTPAEMEIQKSLKTEVEVRFTDRPLKEVLDTLGSLVGVNLYPDPQALAAEGVTTDTPVTINLSKPISLQSALNLILEPLRLSYVIQNEVLLITSEQTRNSKVYPRVYNVADLVIPIPNFVPGYNVGLPSAIREAHNTLGYGGVLQPISMNPSGLTIAANEIERPASLNPSVLAQSNAYGMLSKPNSRPNSLPGQGPGNLGGAAMADFDTLIELITSTVAPDTWDTVGGPGAIESFPTNLSLVISQTQDVHDQIADLLEQLRRLQDLQVAIEVRFITLRDDFFEYMGVNFDFSIDDNVTVLPGDDAGPSTVIGLNRLGLPTSDWDLDFTQDSFGTAVPAFGGFDPATAANFGFAILSDIEVFFLLQAGEGDTRSNVLQAPKVTLFNGQLASVNDTSQRPFVTSLIPVVGDFAAAHQPVICVLSEGTSLSVQAVVSSDRRFVRLTLVPFFSQIGEVDTFTFQGRTATDSGTNVVDPDGNPTGEVDNEETATEGTTVQLPTFSFTTVSTTVSVPDGGTVLLGGIKRLREARNEEGVPMLSKLPYVNRLFKNVGIGRETTSLMLMVTPRIIIQEEEESKLGIEITP